MSNLFLTVLNMSITGAFVIIVICLARQPLKKAPKVITCTLWAVAGLRLIFPFTIEGLFSLIPFNHAPIPADIATQPLPRIDSGVPVVNNAVNNILPAATPYYSVNPLQIWVAVGMWVWLLGVVVMLVYLVVSFVTLWRRMQNAVHVEANIYEASNIKSPFVLGIFVPKIYLPVGLAVHERGYILMHEQTHIRRRDHLKKLVAFFILCIHWFNPLVWLAFLLMNADTEMSCDEQVMNELGSHTITDYTMSLVRIATGKRAAIGSPLAFCEGGIEGRVKRVLSFKRPSWVASIIMVVLAFALGMGLATTNRTAGAVPENNEPHNISEPTDGEHAVPTMYEPVDYEHNELDNENEDIGYGINTPDDEIELPSEGYPAETEANNVTYGHVHISEITPGIAVPLARVWIGEGITYDVIVEAELGSNILIGLRPNATDTNIAIGRWFSMNSAPRNPHSATVPSIWPSSSFMGVPSFVLPEGYYYLFVGNNSLDVMQGVQVSVTGVGTYAGIEFLDVS